MKHRKAGRPKLDKTMSDVIRFRVLPEVARAAERYRRKHSYVSISEAARRAFVATLTGEGLL